MGYPDQSYCSEFQRLEEDPEQYIVHLVWQDPLPEDTPEPFKEEPSLTKPTPQRSPAPENEAKPLQKACGLYGGDILNSSLARPVLIDLR